MAAKPDAVLIAPTDVTAMQNPLQQAAQSTKVVLVDTTTDNPSYATSAIASDNEGGGKAAFDAIKQLNPNGGKVMVMSDRPRHLHRPTPASRASRTPSRPTPSSPT